MTEGGSRLCKIYIAKGPNISVLDVRSSSLPKSQQPRTKDLPVHETSKPQLRLGSPHRLKILPCLYVDSTGVQEEKIKN